MENDPDTTLFFQWKVEFGPELLRALGLAEDDIHKIQHLQRNEQDKHSQRLASLFSERQATSSNSQTFGPRRSTSLAPAFSENLNKLKLGRRAPKPATDAQIESAVRESKEARADHLSFFKSLDEQVKDLHERRQKLKNTEASPFGGSNQPFEEAENLVEMMEEWRETPPVSIPEKRRFARDKTEVENLIKQIEDEIKWWECEKEKAKLSDLEREQREALETSYVGNHVNYLFGTGIQERIRAQRERIHRDCSETEL
jgi:hypothetical protein